MLKQETNVSFIISSYYTYWKYLCLISEADLLNCHVYSCEICEVYMIDAMHPWEFIEFKEIEDNKY